MKMAVSSKTFRVDGHLFRVQKDGTLQYFTHNFDENSRLGEMAGFWKSIKKVFKVAAPIAAIAAGANYATGGKIFSGISNYLPSSETIGKAATIGATLLTARMGAKAATAQAALQYQQQQNMLPSDALNPGNIRPAGITDQFQPPQQAAGYKLGIDPKLLMIGGAGVLVLLLAMRKR